MDRTVNTLVSQEPFRYLPRENHTMLKASCLVFAIFCCAEQINASSLSGKVLNNYRGTPAVPNEFPFQAAIYYTYNGTNGEQYSAHGCCGSILNDRWIITAAECVDGLEDISTIFVVVGTVNAELNNTIYAIESYQVHPDFEEDHYFYQHNVALIKTNVSIEFNEQIQPVELYTGEVNEDVAVQINGWVRQIIYCRM